MFASAFAIVKWVLVLISGGTLYQGFSNNNNNTLAAKIAGAIVTTITMVAFASDASGLLAGNPLANPLIQSEAVKSEQLFWESVERHPSEKLYRDYLKAYPEGQFKEIALAQLAVTAQPAPIAKTEPTAPASTSPAPVQTEPAIITPTPAINPTEDWQTIDHYQVKGGLVRDTKTGLMWMRCSLGQKWDGSCQEEEILYKWKDAMNSTIDFSYEGYSDWRVPSIDELKTLIYCSSGKKDGANTGFACGGDYAKPTIMTDVFPQVLIPQINRWWSSSTSSYEGNPRARTVTFEVGRDDMESIRDGSRSFVRLVRDEKKPPISATIDHYQVKEGVVTDTKTGLMWMRCSAGQNWDNSTCQDSPEENNFETTIKMANDFSYAGYNDWRVPTLEELKTLVYCSSGHPKKWDDIHDECEGNYTKPTIMSDVFPRTPWIIGFWTSTHSEFGTISYMILNFSNAKPYSDYNHHSYYVRFVRGGK